MDATGLSIVYTILIGGTATSALTELLKLPFIPVAAQKYPRTTAAILSIISAVVSMLLQGISFDASNLPTLAVNAGGAFLISALTYNQALRGLSTNKPE